jgi:hypothetical protein
MTAPQDPFHVFKDYLHEEISPHDVGELLDMHLHDLFQLIAETGAPITRDQASAYYHLRRLRDMFRTLEPPRCILPTSPGTMSLN